MEEKGKDLLLNEITRRKSLAWNCVFFHKLILHIFVVFVCIVNIMMCIHFYHTVMYSRHILVLFISMRRNYFYPGAKFAQWNNSANELEMKLQFFLQYTVLLFLFVL